jgi:hypothetical protein
MFKLVFLNNLSEANIPSSKFILHEPYCIRNVKKCHCRMIINIEEEEEHHKEYHIEIKCLHCHKKFPKSQVSHHQTSCDHIQNECRYCTLGVAKKDLDEHEYTCGAKTEQCEICHKYVPIKFMEKHIANNCDGEDHYLNKHIDVNKLEVVKNKNRPSILDKKIPEEVKEGSKISANVEKVETIKVDIPKDRIINKENRVDKPKESHFVVDKFNKYSKLEQDKAHHNINSMLMDKIKNSHVKMEPKNNKIEVNRHRIDLNKLEPSKEEKVKQEKHKFVTRLKVTEKIIQPKRMNDKLQPKEKTDIKPKFENITKLDNRKKSFKPEDYNEDYLLTVKAFNNRIT